MRTIGVLTSWLEDAYEISVLGGIYSAAQQAGANLLCLGGGHVNSPFERQRNRIFDLVSPARVDGLLLLSGTLSSFVTQDEFRGFCDRFRPLPLVSIAVPMAGMPSVLVDNAFGMRQLLAHLIDVHGCRRIAFLRGPLSNVEATARYEVYRSVLSARAMPVRRELEYAGDFLAGSGAAAIRELSDVRRVAFDAVLASNDLMALGALAELQARGVRVPEQMPVVGFDDTKDASVVTPPLTTVRQPLEEVGRRAVQLLLDHLSGPGGSEQVILPTELVVRESCGCLAHHELLNQSTPSTPLAALAALEAAWTDQTLAEMMAALPAAAGPPASQAAELLAAFEAQLAAPDEDLFLPALARVLRWAVNTGQPLEAWRKALERLARRRMALESEPAGRARIESLWQAAGVVLAESGQRMLARSNLQAEQRAKIFNSITRSLLAAADLNSLVDDLANQLPRLGLKRCYLALYDTAAASPGALQPARLIMGYDPAGRLPLPPGGQRFPAPELVPSAALSRLGAYSLIAGQLFIQDEPLGFISFALEPGEGRLYEELREQISSAVKGVLLTEQRDRLRADLETHAQELERAYQALQENQNKLLLEQKMASLGRLTAGIAHEMNTPLAAVRAAQADLSRLVDEYRAAIGDPDITPDDHADIARDMAAAIRLADQSAAKAASFVRGIKAQTRDMDPRQQVRFNAYEIIQDALNLLEFSFKRSNCRAELVGESGVMLYGTPPRLMQVVINLLSNAVDASAARGGGLIGVRLRADEQGVALQVSDEGSGIAPEVLPKIFDPLFTTKPFGEGTGLGLAIVHDIVVGEFGGTINVESQPGRGTTFTLRFPRNA